MPKHRKVEAKFACPKCGEDSIRKISMARWDSGANLPPVVVECKCLTCNKEWTIDD